MNYKFMFFYLLGMVTVACLSFKVGFTYQVVKPFKPKETIILEGTHNLNIYLKKGFQVHSISDGYSGRVYIVMVKYFDEE